MADEQDSDSEKSEDPTQKRLDEATKRGDVASSHEVNTWFVLAGGTLVLSTFSGSVVTDLQTTMRGIIANVHAIPGDDGPALLKVIGNIELRVLAALAIPLLVLVLAAIGGNLVQHHLIWSAEALKPKLSKVSPIKGLQRLFSRQALVNFIKGLLKLSLVGAVMGALLWPKRHQLMALVSQDPASLLPFTRSLSLDLLGPVVAILAIVAAADYLFQYRQWFNRQKMSRRDMKEEFKQAEGDPVVKGKLRQLRQMRMKKRMMAAVPKASVVITNPTHYAVALQYERGMTAPVCVAKGVDAIARKIREIASAHDIPIVENPTVARALHATVEIDQEIPPEHYKAVAEVIGYVMRLRRAVGR
ncbi:MAG: flagellar biosynthesis protein FlhB [Xanthobacteraceae bacterium]